MPGPEGDVYAAGRTVYDADSHVMELGDFLSPHADPEIRDRIRPLHLGGAGALAVDAVEKAERRRETGEQVADTDILRLKGWHAAGAFDRAERSHALDRLGFAAQLVFSTFSPTQFAGDDLELLFGGTRAHNRTIVEFCRGDLAHARDLPGGDGDGRRPREVPRSHGRQHRPGCDVGGRRARGSAGLRAPLAVRPRPTT